MNEDEELEVEEEGCLPLLWQFVVALGIGLLAAFIILILLGLWWFNG